ncbi:MAG TPA: hypothetical protein PLH63_04680, partial [Candidatus Cloacimonadota bacterium]|nr:hypothetical protein [Candidatus Cloacimonadota bacterium]
NRITTITYNDIAENDLPVGSPFSTSKTEIAKYGFKRFFIEPFFKIPEEEDTCYLTPNFKILLEGAFVKYFSNKTYYEMTEYSLQSDLVSGGSKLYLLPISTKSYYIDDIFNNYNNTL